MRSEEIAVHFFSKIDENIIFWTDFQQHMTPANSKVVNSQILRRKISFLFISRYIFSQTRTTSFLFQLYYFFFYFFA